MITAPDFAKKQIVFIFFKDGEKLSFANDNMVVKNSEGEIILQCTCYRLFLVIGVGHCTITSGLLQRAKKFEINIALFTQSFKLYSFISAQKEGNTLLRKKQYEYQGLDIAKVITKNKISTQYRQLMSQRAKEERTIEALKAIDNYYSAIDEQNSLNSIMAYEGLSSKMYFAAHFNNVEWKGRQPRIKRDYVNSTLDIGYTILFSFIDSILLSFGFDTYCGVLHRQFYMRKSLTCDIIEPFRTLVDVQVRKSINLGQIRIDDFEVHNHQFRLKWKNNSEYIKFLMNPIMEYKQEMFEYVQSYYRCFMKNTDSNQFPFFRGGEVRNGNHKL